MIAGSNNCAVLYDLYGYRKTYNVFCCKPLHSAVATVEANEAASSVKILTGAIIISVIKITIVTFNANSTI